MLLIKCDFILSDGFWVFEILKYYIIYFLKMVFYRWCRFFSILFEILFLKGFGGVFCVDFSMGY